jgi:hypothetical protein
VYTIKREKQMLVFVVIDDKAGKQEQKKVYVFDNHDDALRCRRDLRLDSHHLYGTSIGCYDFRPTDAAGVAIRLSTG